MMKNFFVVEVALDQRYTSLLIIIGLEPEASRHPEYRALPQDQKRSPDRTYSHHHADSRV